MQVLSAKQNPHVCFICWPAAKCCFSFSHNYAHITCFYELPQLLFFFIFQKSTQNLTLLETRGKSGISAQSNSRPLRFSLPFLCDGKFQAKISNYLMSSSCSHYCWSCCSLVLLYTYVYIYIWICIYEFTS